MKLGALVLIAGLVAPALFACAQPASPLRPRASNVAQAAEPTTFPSCQDRNVIDPHGKPDGSLFVTKRVFLLNNLNPSTSSGYSLPTGPSAANSAYAPDLIGAFNAAPRFFQEQLCGLDGVFVNLKCADPNHCTPDDAADNSWGYRETLDQNPQEPARRFIAISAVLWGSNPHVDNFYDFETKLLHQLFKRGSGGVDWGPPGPQYGDSHANHGENVPAITVLAALAHEFGHVLWRDTFRPIRSNDIWANDYSQFCHGRFFDDSWAPVPAHAGSAQAGTMQPAYPPDPWRSFGQRSPQLHKFDDVQVSSIDDAVRQNDPADPLNNRAYLLDSIFRTDGRWASFFAALSPDEDFVETFKFHVLRKANTPVKNLPITIPGPPQLSYPPFQEDVFRDQQGKAVFAKKVACFSAIYP